MSYPYIQEPRDEQRNALKKIFRVKTVLVIGDMGVGKTKIGVDFAANLVWHKKSSRVVVIAPLPALGVWEQQIEDNCPFINYTFYTKDELPNWNAHILLINYDYLCPRRKKRVNRKGNIKYYIDKKIINQVIDWKPDICILDEGHKIKNAQSRRSKAIHKLGPVSKYRIVLTGTPSGNKASLDLWSQFEFLRPGMLGKLKDFKRIYGIWGGFGGFKFLGCKNLERLSKILSPYIIRIKKEGLPPKNFIPYRVNLPRKAREFYDQMEEEFLISIDGVDVTAPIALAKMSKLSQISGGFIKSNDGEELDIHRAKLYALREILEDLEESGTNRVVIFARFRWELRQILLLLDELNWKYHRVSGRVPKEAVNDFNDGENKMAMVCQIASGSVANNFQASNYMIFFSTDYSLINFQQAQDRIHRIGQTLPCFYYLLQCKGTIDVRIYRLLSENHGVAEHLKNLISEMKNANRN